MAIILETRGFLSFTLVISGCAQVAVSPAENTDILMNEHFVPVVSRVSSMAGSVSQIYLRERVRDSVQNEDDLNDKIVIFIHGAGTPAEVAFDVSVAGFSWMEYLAGAISELEKPVDQLFLLLL